MNILKRELKANAKSLLIWCLAMASLIYMGMIKYAAFEKTGQAVNQFFEQMPPAMMQVMGIESGYDLTSVAVFYSIFFLYFMLLASVHSVMLGTLIIIKEERDKTADFLYVKPMKRSAILTYKMLAAFLNIFILNLVTFGVSLMALRPYAEASLTKSVWMTMIGLFLIQVLFLGLGLCFGGLFKGSKTGTSIGTTLILGSFLLKVLIDLNHGLRSLEGLTPFRYFQSGDLMFKHYISGEYTLLTLALTSLGIAGMYYGFRKRDIA